MKRSIIIFICIAAFGKYGKAQVSYLDSAKNEIFRINKIFDSSSYLGFDLSIEYKSDSANVTKETDQMEGNYVLNGHNIYYQMGGGIYLQTDSFAYNIYPEEQMMIMTKNFIAENSNVFPLRTFVDSMMLYYGNNYTVTLENIQSDSFEFVRRIKFDKLINNNNSQTDATQYNYFYIDYSYGQEAGYYIPVKFEFSYDEETSDETTDSLGNNIGNGNIYLATKTVTMNFSRFKPVIDTDIFDDTKYVYYNRERKVYEPTDRFRDFQLNTSGFDNEDEDAESYREIPAVRNY